MAKQRADQPDKVTAFLVGLATDPAKLGRFIQSPDAELEAAGIDEADRAILKSGNAAAIHARIGGQPAAPRPDPMFMLVSMSDDGEGGTRPSVAQALPMVFAQQMMPPMIFAQQPMWPPMIFAQQMMPPMIFAGHQTTPMLFMMNASASPTTPMLFMMNASQSPTLPMAPPAAHPHALGAAAPSMALMSPPMMWPFPMSPYPMMLSMMMPTTMPQMMMSPMPATAPETDKAG